MLNQLQHINPVIGGAHVLNKTQRSCYMCVIARTVPFAFDSIPQRIHYHGTMGAVCIVT